MTISDIRAVHIISCPRLRWRVPIVRQELSRIGINPKTCLIQEHSPGVNAFDRDFLASRRGKIQQGYMTDIRYVSQWRNMYQAIKTAEELGHQYVLFVEDDAMFLKDVDQINRSLGELPEDFECAMLDVLCPHKGHYLRGLNNGKAKGLTCWGHTPGGVPLRSTAAYVLRHNACKTLAQIYETIIYDPWLPLETTDCLWQRFANSLHTGVYFAAPNLAIQANFNHSYELSGHKIIHLRGITGPRQISIPRKYSYMKTNCSDYQVYSADQIIKLAETII